MVNSSYHSSTVNEELISLKIDIGASLLIKNLSINIIIIIKLSATGLTAELSTIVLSYDRFAKFGSLK